MLDKVLLQQCRRQGKPVPLRCWFTDFWFRSEEAQIRNSGLVKRTLSKHYDLRLSPDKPDVLFYSCFGHQFRRYNCPRIFWTGEPVQPNFAECDFAVSFDMDGPSNHYYPLAAYMQRPLAAVLSAARLTEKTRFCNFIHAKDVGFRNRFVSLLSERQRVDAPGQSCNNMDASAELPGRNASNSMVSKIEFMRRYKFSIAFENRSKPGYTTEKIVHAFAAKSVPIYWGNPDIEELFDPAAFINVHRYRSLEQAVEAVLQMDRDDDLFQSCLHTFPLRDGRLPPGLDEGRLIAALDNFLLSFAEGSPRI